MPRKNLAQEIYGGLEVNEIETNAEWLVVYDFKDVKPHLNFWTNIHRLASFGGDSKLIQFSVFKTRKKKIAFAAKKLAEHYGAETFVFNILRLES
jgi:hypothetical protein